jgi:hypothetical protein
VEVVALNNTELWHTAHHATMSLAYWQNARQLAARALAVAADERTTSARHAAEEELAEERCADRVVTRNSVKRRRARTHPACSVCHGVA